jgi:hypothetical protein
VDDLRGRLALLSAYRWSPEPPKGLRTNLVAWAPRSEGQEDVTGTLVEVAGEPKERSSVEERVTYLPFKDLFGTELEIRVPRCGVVPEGTEPYDSYPVEAVITERLKDSQLKNVTLAPQVHLKVTEREVKRWTEVKVVRFLDEGEKPLARVGDLVKLDLQKVMEPLAAHIYSQYGAEMVDRALILGDLLKALERVQDLSIAAGPVTFRTALEELAKQEEYLSL